jgi:aminopeptidase
VRSSALAEPLLVELHKAILDRGAWPFLRIELPGQARAFYDHAPDWMLDEASPFALREAREMTKSVSIQAPYDPRELVDVDPAKMARLQRAQRPVREQAMKRRWCSTLWPTAPAAERAGMSLPEFEAFVARALFLDRPAGAVAAWGELSEFQAYLIKRLKGASELRIEAEGTDVTLNVKGRTWQNSDGRRNMPSGEVFTGPHEASATGRIRFDLPSSPAGVVVAGVELELRDGEVVSARADEGDEYLQQVLQTDAGARRLGEVGIGTNYGIDRPIGATLFDEKIGGTVHMALGRSYPETGGKNESAVHWDLICDLRRGGRLTADGAVVQEDGRFAV